MFDTPHHLQQHTKNVCFIFSVFKKRERRREKREREEMREKRDREEMRERKKRKEKEKEKEK